MKWGDFFSKSRPQTISVFHQEQKPCSGFFFVALLFHKDPKSPSVETVTGYKPFGFVPSSFIKVKRQTHSQISVRIHYDWREECRPTKYSSCLKKLGSFSLSIIHMLRGLQLCSGYRLRIAIGLLQFLQPFGCNKMTGINTFTASYLNTQGLNNSCLKSRQRRP